MRLLIRITVRGQSRQRKQTYKYGFILRYPQDKVDITKYNYEPWHFRYVGPEAAKEIFEKKICLEEYLGL